MFMFIPIIHFEFFVLVLVTKFLQTDVQTTLLLRGIKLPYESQQSRCSLTADYPGCFSITGNLVVGISRSPIRFLETPPMSRETHAGGSRWWLAAVQTVGLHTPSICRLARTHAFRRPSLAGDRLRRTK